MAIIALWIAIQTPILASRWANVPFVGALFEPHNVIVSNSSENWPAQDQGANFPDRLKALGGQPVENTDEIYSILEENEYFSEIIQKTNYLLYI